MNWIRYRDKWPGSNLSCIPDICPGETKESNEQISLTVVSITAESQTGQLTITSQKCCLPLAPHKTGLKCGQSVQSPQPFPVPATGDNT